MAWAIETAGTSGIWRRNGEFDSIDTALPKAIDLGNEGYAVRLVPIRNDLRNELQTLRDRAELESLASKDRGDGDSADAWERIGLGIDDLQKSIAQDWRLIQARRPAEF